MPGLSLIAFETTRDGNGEIYLLDTSSGRLTNLTRNAADDRAPAWRPDGGAVAFESHRDGNWEVYVLDLSTAALRRVTDDPAYDGAPAWSPDGTQIAFESYRDGKLQIYVVAASGGEPRRLTEDPAGAYGPAWSPDGLLIAFTTWRDGNKETYAVAAQGGEARNLTQNSADDEDPAWSPDGTSLAFVSWRDVDPQTGNRNAEIYLLTLADGTARRLTDNPWPDLDPAWDAAGRLVWSSYVPGPAFETHDPYRPGGYHVYRMGQDGPELLADSTQDDWHPAPAPARVTDLGPLAERLAPLPDVPTPSPTLAPGTLAQVVDVPGVLAGPDGPPIKLNELVVPSLLAWREALLQASGYDFLHVTAGSWRNLGDARQKILYAYDYRWLSWHKTGRALDLAFELKVNGADRMIKVRDDLGSNTYWRMYLKTARQDGSQGEPLKDNPWRFWWQIDPNAEPQAYDAGGKRLPIPAGYYVDVTALARLYGWERIASYNIAGDYRWTIDSNGTEYWQYERTDGLTWWDAMSQIYPLDQLEKTVGWQAGFKHDVTEAMMQSKGVPAP